MEGEIALSRAAGWSLADVPDQSGKIAVVTGANSGIGGAGLVALAAHPGFSSTDIARNSRMPLMNRWIGRQSIAIPSQRNACGRARNR